jgi:2-methylcitrate dehydratase PrpD
MSEPVALSRRIVRKTRAIHVEGLPPEAYAKARLALRDFLSCVFESKDLPQSLQAKAAGHGDLAFVSAVLGHGLVREDMHTASVSHLGIVVFPTLLKLAQTREVSGRDFFAAAVYGYEVGAAIGRALMDAETVRVFRPTGITGPLGAAVAGAMLLGLDEDECVNALGFAANATVGLNEWAQAGTDEMFFHVGFAARNAVTAVELAAAGARASETALDGKAGLFAALRRLDRVNDVHPFERALLEIMEVFHKPAGACNYAQTAIQAASQLAIAGSDIKSARVRCTAAAINYPGCDSIGPYGSILQAKMSIQHGVSVALGIEPSIIALEEDPKLTASYPAQQGAEVIATLNDGREVSKRLRDLTPASDHDVWARFEQSASAVAPFVAEEDFQALANALEKL